MPESFSCSQPRLSVVTIGYNFVKQGNLWPSRQQALIARRLEAEIDSVSSCLLGSELSAL